MKVHYIEVDGQVVELTPEEARVRLNSGELVVYGELPVESSDDDEESESG